MLSAKYKHNLCYISYQTNPNFMDHKLWTPVQKSTHPLIFIFQKILTKLSTFIMDSHTSEKIDPLGQSKCSPSTVIPCSYERIKYRIQNRVSPWKCKTQKVQDFTIGLFNTNSYFMHRHVLYKLYSLFSHHMFKQFLVLLRNDIAPMDLK